MAARPSSTTKQGYTAQYRRLRPWILERDGYRCVQCGTTDHLQVDHLVPLSKGGTNHPTNLRVLCRRCNLNRREMPPSWAQSKQQLRARFAGRGSAVGALVDGPVVGEVERHELAPLPARPSTGRPTGALADRI